MRERHNPLLSDIWSLGVILYELVVGDSPFADCVTMDQLMDRIYFETQVPLPESLSPGVRCLLEQLLSFDPSRRPRAAQIKASLTPRTFF